MRVRLFPLNSALSYVRSSSWASQDLAPTVHWENTAYRCPDIITSQEILDRLGYHGRLSLTYSATLPKQDDFRNFLMSEECADMAQLVANLA